MTTLRPYQTDLIDRARVAMRDGYKSLILQAPTGSGKTLLTAFMLKSASEKGMRSIFCVHRRELILQVLRTFRAVGIHPGVIAAGFQSDARPLVQVASIQSLARRLHKVPDAHLLVIDEAHHSIAAGWHAVIQRFHTAYVIGLTATPQRLDGRGLSTIFSHLIVGPPIRGLIDAGYLSAYRIYAPSGISTQGIHVRHGDYATEELSEAADKPSITGDVIAHYRKLADGKRALVRCVSREHSRRVAVQFVAAGYAARHVDGETPTADRDAAFHDFAAGRLRILTQVDLVNEGLDIAGIDCAIDLRPTMSLTLWLQFCGRALRPAEGKAYALILDHAGNTLRHGLPEEERDWTLDGRAKSKTQSLATASVRLCPACFAAQPPGGLVCRFCGAAFEVKSRNIEQRDGHLVEIDPVVIRQQFRREQGQCETLEELVALGKRRGYKRPFLWAHHVFQSRQARKLSSIA